MHTELFQKIKNYDQQHLLNIIENLSVQQKENYIMQLSSIDFELLKQLSEKNINNSKNEKQNLNLEPVNIIAIPETEEQKQYAKKAKTTGEEMLRTGKVAALLVAGGQGTRLGIKGPKGLVSAGTVSNKTLFQLHADKINALSKKYDTPIPWLIMTSEVNDKETREYFETNNYLGLNKNNIYFFTQGMIPAVDESGHVFMDQKDHVFTNPNGHGGTLHALKDGGVLAKLKRRGIEELFYFQIDNVLIKICDPYFIGYHTLESAEMSAKIVKKTDAAEKVGVIGRLDGKITAIEYSDMPLETLEEKNEDGSLKYSAGSIAIHMFKMSFIEKITSGELKLPYHVAHKSISHLNKKGKLVKPEKPNGYKFEMFIFDALPMANASVIMEVVRENEFSPIKNKTGIDSLVTAQRDLNNYFGQMLKSTGIEIPFDSENNVVGNIEINSTFALDEEELKDKIPQNLKFKNNLYLE